MHNLTIIAIAAFLACTFVTGAVASPITFDGTVDAGDTYPAWIDDPAEGVFGSDGLDIDGVGFDEIAGWLYIGVDTVGQFDRDGGPTAFPQVTQFLFRLNDGSQTHTYMMLIDGGAIAMFEGITPILAGWTAQIANDLEIRLDTTVLMPGFDHHDFFFQARLDNSDYYADDVIAGDIGIPEPTTMSLLAIGSLAALRRRSRARQAGQK